MRPYFIIMNYSLTDIPDSGDNVVVYMDIGLNGETLGRIHIRLFRDVFPAGVENFIRIATGQTSRIIEKGSGRYRFNKEITRTYEKCKFYRFSHNNYIVCGDIYHNNGTGAGTIYNDQPILPEFGEYYYPHEFKGLVSLIPFIDDETGTKYYDSTFMITLDDAKSTNVLADLDRDQIVIGQICKGIDIIDTMNKLIKPFAGRRYPKFVITQSGLYRNSSRRRRLPISYTGRKFRNPPRLVNPD